MLPWFSVLSFEEFSIFVLGLSSPLPDSSVGIGVGAIPEDSAAKFSVEASSEPDFSVLVSITGEVPRIAVAGWGSFLVVEEISDGTGFFWVDISGRGGRSCSGLGERICVLLVESVLLALGES